MPTCGSSLMAAVMAAETTVDVAVKRKNKNQEKLHGVRNQVIHHLHYTDRHPAVGSVIARVVSRSCRVVIPVVRANIGAAACTHLPHTNLWQQV
jgi:hypothetical protein